MGPHLAWGTSTVTFSTLLIVSLPNSIDLGYGLWPTFGTEHFLHLAIRERVRPKMGGPEATLFTETPWA